MFRQLLCLVLATSFASGCATAPYRYGSDIERANMTALGPDDPQFERGTPNRWVDGIGWVFGIPSKILLLDRRMDNHHVSTEVEDALRRYIHSNELYCVKVRINQYEPRREWCRLFRNRSIGVGWRYTLGFFAWLSYTVFPGRVFGGDNYNPYSNTINLYSDVQAVALHEGGHAKDFAPRKWKGTYGFFYVLPFAALYAEARASNDAISYLYAQPSVANEEEGYKVLYPAYATYIGGETTEYLFVNPWLYFVGLIPGHLLGRWKAAHVEARRDEQTHDAADTEGTEVEEVGPRIDAN